MRFTPWALALSLCATALLSACGGGSKSSTTQVRLLNATQTYAALDLSVNDKTIDSKVAYATAGAYGDVDTGSTASKVLTSDVGTSVAATTPTLTQGSNYTIIAYGWPGAVRTSLLQEAETAPDTGKAKLLVLNLAPDAGAVDVYVTTATDTLDTATTLATNIAGGSGSGYNLINAGTFRVRVTGYNKRTDLRLDIPALTLASAGVTTLILTPTDGGLLVNGMQLEQKGAVTNFANTQSRVRVVGALSGNASVAGSVNGTALIPTSVSPTIGEYVTTKAGASVLSMSVNGAPFPVSAPSLKAGGDYTLMLWGTPAAPQFSVLADDNRLPTTNGNVKMRLINGLTAAGPSLTLNLDFSALARNVVPGTSSTPASVSSTTSSQLDVNAPTSVAPIFSKSSLALTANGVYTVFMLGDPAAPVGTLRKER
jgi:hypothetical protein